jgi:CRP-like cAMP-binding protein
MSGNFIKLYSQQTPADTAFMLEEGRVFFYPNTADKYAVNGKNLIIGATELVMTHMLGVETGRMETAIATADSKLKRMPLDKFRAGLESLSFILNVSIVMAKQVSLTNSIINRTLTEMAGDESRGREHSMEYFNIIDRLRREYDRRRLPWLQEIVREGELNLCYKRGEAYCKSSEPVKVSDTVSLSEKVAEYPRGAVICEQDSMGSEMFILQSGVIDVIINGNSVATIEEPGTVIGEMAMLLGEKRSATLMAKNGVVATKLTKEDLKATAARDPGLVRAIMQSLAKRHYYNIIKIGDINEKAMRKMLSEEESKKAPSQLGQTQKSLHSLKDRIMDAVRNRDYSFMKDLVDAL